MGLPGEEIAETEGTPYENESDARARGLPEHERDDDVAGDAGGGLMASGGTATDYGRASGEGGPSAGRRDQDDDLINPDDSEEDATGGFLARREPGGEGARD